MKRLAVVVIINDFSDPQVEILGASVKMRKLALKILIHFL